MNASKGDARLFAFESRQLHVRRINGVHIIRRERRVLLLLVDRLRVKVLRERDLLDDGLQHILLSQILIWLDAGQAKRRLPLDRIASCCHNPGAFGKPFFNVVGILE